jgi:hypothetical protein
MAFHYFCDNLFRAQRFRTDPTITLNGIDVLEVLDRESPVDALRQHTLMVRLFRPVPATLTAANVEIEGGVRIKTVNIQWVGIASQAAALEASGRISPAERAYFSALTKADHVFLVRTDSDGDYSFYTMRLVASPTAAEPPAGFDPILSTVKFSFKVECPTDFDCQTEQVCPEEVLPSPAINYLAKDYQTFRQLILDRMAVTHPQWNETHVPDLNIALVELLAYVGDYLSYYQDSVATEAYLGTARRRTSLRRHARLLNYPMHDGCNARTWVCFTAEAGVNGERLKAPKTISGSPVRLLTRMPSETHKLAESDLLRLIGEHQPAVFELQTSVMLYEAHNEISFHTWGDEACCLPKGATRATLRSSNDIGKRLNLVPGDVLIVEEVLGPQTGLAADADPSHRQALRLTHVEATVDPVDGIPVVNIEWEAADALTFALCLSVRLNDTLVEDVSVARGNVGLADHGRTVDREPLPLKTDHRTYRPVLSETDITVAVAIDRKLDAETDKDINKDDDNDAAVTVAKMNPLIPAIRSLVQDPQEALPVIELAGDGEAWRPQRDLLESDRFAPHFVSEREQDGRVYLRFGDDRHYGLSPSTDAFSQAPNGAVYRVGSGVAGNIGADTLYHLIGADVSVVTAVRNPLPATGGIAPENLEEVRQYAPQAFRRQERAVTPADYVEVAMRHPAVQRAEATRRWTGSWYTIFVTIDRLGGEAVDAAFEQDIRDHLEKYRLTGHDIEVDAPQFVPLDIRMSVCVKPGYFRPDVEAQLLQIFSNRVLSSQERGFFHADNFTFGQPVYLSDVIATAMAVSGVQWVDILPTKAKDHRFQRWGQAPNDEIDRGQINMARLEIAQLDNDPSRPEHGRIAFYMEGGQ